MEARITLLVSDQFQGQGIGGELMRRFITIARDEKIKRILATISPENMAMRGSVQAAWLPSPN